MTTTVTVKTHDWPVCVASAQPERIVGDLADL